MVGIDRPAGTQLGHADLPVPEGCQAGWVAAARTGHSKRQAEQGSRLGRHSKAPGWPTGGVLWLGPGSASSCCGVRADGAHMVMKTSNAALRSATASHIENTGAHSFNQAA